MQQNYFNPYKAQCYPQQGPSAVSINIVAPQAIASPNGNACATNPYGYYPLYGANTNNTLPMYPSNYNNLAIQQNPYINNSTQQPSMPQRNLAQQPFVPQDNSQNDLSNKHNLVNETNLVNKTNSQTETNNSADETKKTKKVVPLTDDYIKSIENYMNNDNPKVRLIGTKELLERFKEDENRKDNPSLMPLLNKALKDTSSAVRFLALTILQLGYAVGNDETVTILKDIQSKNTDKIGEDALLASEILLKMAAPQKVEAPMTQNEIEKANAKNSQNNQVKPKEQGGANDTNI